ncbi:hypothetical protein DY000_02048966 [Brassica cretica]|uniref:Uncharacterized protein n=1 Tax=Brassica cretica TaxID=69181 RepID=A0ABQ7ETU3_BRACR|nr:hypothetical protein DY000_02048966 [Brassica cretica]
MALFIMKWMDLSFKECRMQGLSFLRASPFHWLLDFSSFGIVLVDILEESNSSTELLRFLGHMTRCFRGARSSFGSSSFCIRDRTRCHYWRRATCRSFVFHELVRGRFVSASLGFRELDSSRDFCVAFGRLWWSDLDRGTVEMLLRSRNVRIVKWKIREHLEILLGLIVLRCGENSSSLEGERGVLVVVVAQLFSSSISSKILASLVVGVENGYDEVNVKIPAEYKYVFPQQIMLGQENVETPATDRSEYDDQNTDEPSSVITQLPHMHAVRSLHSDRVFVSLGRYVATELFRNVDTTLVKKCSLGVVLVDILEESNSATELLRFLGHMAHCFRGARSSFGSSSFCIRDRTRCHYWRRATYRPFVFLSSLEFVSASLGFPKLDSSRDFCVVFDRSN